MLTVTRASRPFLLLANVEQLTFPDRQHGREARVTMVPLIMSLRPRMMRSSTVSRSERVERT